MHRLVACKGATACRCGLPAPSITTSNRYQPLEDPNPDPPVHEVEKIVATRTNQQGAKQYYIKWVGYAPHQNTWEDEEALTQAPEILSDFLSQTPDPPPPLSQCQFRVCSAAAVGEFPRCQSITPSTRCNKHSSVPCGPATHCPCHPRTKRQRPVSPPPLHPEPQTPTQPPPTAPHTAKACGRPSQRSPTSERTHTQPYSIPSDTPPASTSHSQSPQPLTPAEYSQRTKRPPQVAELSPPPPAKHPCPRPTAQQVPSTSRQPKRNLPESEQTPAPLAKKPHTRKSTAPS